MFSWVLGQLPPRKIVPIPKTNPKPNPNPNWGRGAIFLGGNSLSQTLTLTGFKLKGLAGAWSLLEGKVKFTRKAMIPLPFAYGSLSA